jgi:hypothetical protein
MLLAGTPADGVGLCSSGSINADYKCVRPDHGQPEWCWRAIVDPFENGKSGFSRNEKPRGKSDCVEYSFAASPVLNVPGDWNTQREQLMFYDGPVWYRREFGYHRHANSRVFVYFGAANYHTSVYLNGEKLGEHEGGSRHLISKRLQFCEMATTF